MMVEWVEKEKVLQEEIEKKDQKLAQLKATIEEEQLQKCKGRQQGVIAAERARLEAEAAEREKALQEEIKRRDEIVVEWDEKEKALQEEIEQEVHTSALQMVLAQKDQALCEEAKKLAHRDRLLVAMEEEKMALEKEAAAQMQKLEQEVKRDLVLTFAASELDRMLEVENKLLDKQVAKRSEQQVEAQFAAPSQQVESRWSRSQHKQATARAYQLKIKLKQQRVALARAGQEEQETALIVIAEQERTLQEQVDENEQALAQRPDLMRAVSSELNGSDEPPSGTTYNQENALAKLLGVNAAAPQAQPAAAPVTGRASGRLTIEALQTYKSPAKKKAHTVARLVKLINHQTVVGRSNLSDDWTLTRTVPNSPAMETPIESPVAFLINKWLPR